MADTLRLGEALCLRSMLLGRRLAAEEVNSAAAAERLRAAAAAEQTSAALVAQAQEQRHQTHIAEQVRA